MSIEVKRFRLSVWRPAPATRNLMLIPAGPAGSQSGLKHSEFDFHEQIYAWEPREDVWLSLREAEDQRKLRQLLVEAFSPDVPPDQRPISKLAEALDAISEIVKAEGKSDWADNEETVEISGDETINFRSHGMLALHNHLSWVYETFRAMPGASLMIR
jgi:hypothetical protein